jgi:hypothetical protein
MRPASCRCVQWDLVFRYDVRYGGYFRVRMQYKAKSRCSPLRVMDTYIILCLGVGMLALVYQVRTPTSEAAEDAGLGLW